mmetsp:Transcript_37805/g.70542  ORF Transcript_37805/g.70542 Transcript_37805/m.70542 type:complete len:300 (-) Transcript_37805:142-1041(-)
MAGPRETDGLTELQRLVLFKRWAVFLPRLSSEPAKLNATYAIMRQQRNPAFFDQLREKLQMILQDFDIVSASGQACSVEGGLERVLQAVLQCLTFALGFLGNRQFHKAFVLGELCVQVADRAAEGAPELVFWPLLCRMSLGSAYLQLKRIADARQVLEEGLSLGASLEETADGAVQTLLGACFYSLAQADLEESAVEPAADRVDAAVEKMEGHVFEVSQTKEDKEAASTTLATLYHFRGHCDFLCDRFDVALSWYDRALKVLQEHRDLGTDTDAIVPHLRHDIERAMCLKPKEEVLPAS